MRQPRAGEGASSRQTKERIVMCRGKGLAAAIAALLLSSTVASAHVLDPKIDKVPSKLRADVAKQVTGYTLCLVKAASKCESKGVLSSAECDLATGAVSYEPSPGSETTKFQAAVAKCDDKLDLDKKGTDYVGIG